MQSNLLALSRLFAEQLGLERPSEPYSLERFERLVERVMRRAGVAREKRARTRDARIVRVFLKMTQHSYARLLEPNPDPPPELLELCRKIRETAPKTKGHFAQSRIDEASACRRAQVVLEQVPLGSSILMLGDDDGVSPLLASRYRLTTIDLDMDTLRWISESSPEVETFQVDVREIPVSFHERFDAVVADPIRGPEAESFVSSAYRSLAPGGLFFWADHPDWNLAFKALKTGSQPQMQPLGSYPNWHQYPASLLTGGEDLSVLDAESRRFLELGELISLWSNLYILEKTKA